jgi:hypothetical protein
MQRIKQNPKEENPFQKPFKGFPTERGFLFSKAPPPPKNRVFLTTSFYPFYLGKMFELTLF